MDFRKLILNSSFYRILGSLVSIVIAFLLTPFLINQLGENDYGLWLLMLSVLGWFQVMEMGFPGAVQREIARALEAGDNHRINVIFSCSVILFAVLGLFAAGLIILLGQYPAVLGVEESNFAVVNLAFAVFSLKVFWDFLMNCYHGFYSGLIRYDLDANINTANEIIKACLIFLLVRDLQLYGAVLATMVSDLLANAYKALHVRKLHAGIKFDPALVNRRELGDLWAYAKHVIANSVATSFGGRANPFIVSHLFGLTAVAIYGVAARLVDIVERLFLSVLGVFEPVFIRINERKGNIARAVEQVVSLNFFLVSVLFIPLIVLAEDFIALWLGEGFEESVPLVALICAAFLCRTISRPISAVLLATADHKYLSVVNLAGLFINILAAVVLGYFFGLPGVAAGAVVSFYLCNFLLHLLLYRHFIRGPIAGMVRGFVLTNLFVFFSSAAGIQYFATLPPLSWTGLFASGAVIFALATLLFWLLLLDGEVKEKIQDLARMQLGRFLARLQQR